MPDTYGSFLIATIYQLQKHQITYQNIQSDPKAKPRKIKHTGRSKINLKIQTDFLKMIARDQKPRGKEQKSEN